MKIKWLGHATFMITSDTGTRIITDPYARGEYLTYGDIKESADIVTVSHDHFDHNNVAAVGGNPEVVRNEGETWVLPEGVFETSHVRSSIPGLHKDKNEIGYMRFQGIPAYHDESQGKERGNNTIFSFEVDGVKICHLGDLGHPLSDKQVSEIGKVDILLIPVGGFFTIAPRVACQTCDQLNPGVIIPMHYKNDKCGLPIAGVDEFLQGMKDITRLDASEVEFKAGELPASTQTMVLKPAL